jgi:hypothetical protein
MTLLALQRRIAEAGRIRIGQQVAAGNGRTRPEKLETFRLTSPDRRRIEQAAAEYGGKPGEWLAPAGKQWEVVTETDSLEVIVPPSDLSFSQAYELWSAGGCQRRCDGTIESISEGPCKCDADNRECDIHTRLSVMLRDLPGLGVWRLDTSGYYAAVELASAVEIIQLAAGRGALLPARLRLEQRSVKRPGANGKPQTLRFAVPVLDIEITPAQLLSGGAEPLQLAEATSPRPKLTPVPQLTSADLAPSIAEQSEPPGPAKKRANSAPEIPPSGRQRRARAAAPDEPGNDAPEQGDPETEGVASDSAPLESPAPATRPRKAQAAADEDDPEYWMKRIHALGRERGFDHDAVRLVAAGVLSISPGDVDKFTLTELVPVEFQALDAFMRSLPDAITGESSETDLDAVSTWVWPRAHAKGLESWAAVDVFVVAGTGKQPDELSVAEWVSWTARLVAGEFDASGAA